MLRSNTCLLFAGLLFAVPACASSGAVDAKSATEREATPQQPGSTPSAGATDRGDTRSPTTGSIHIDERIVKACGIVATSHFTFDSAKIEGPAGTTLQAVASCFSTGPLEGKDLLLVGHADARGGAMHNLGLGQERASSVGTFLRNNGVEESRVKTRSRGEADAAGNDAEGWAGDRRVDIFLAD